MFFCTKLSVRFSLMKNLQTWSHFGSVGFGRTVNVLQLSWSRRVVSTSSAHLGAAERGVYEASLTSSQRS